MLNDESIEQWERCHDDGVMTWPACLFLNEYYYLVKELP